MQPNKAIILAGYLRPSPIRRGLGLPELSLPLGPRQSLVEAWCLKLSQIEGLQQIVLVVHDDADIQLVSAALGRQTRRRAGNVVIVPEASAWRGTAGILSDAASPLSEDDWTIVVEAACVPPESFEPLLAARQHGDAGVVGITRDGQPCGVYAFSGAAVNRVPAIGYHDLKEQLLPSLHAASLPVRVAQVSSRLIRIRDLASYQEAVQQYMRSLGGPLQHVGPQSSVASTAILEGVCLIEPGAVIEDNAVVHDSVLLSGVTVSAGAVVSGSVIGGMGVVKPGDEVIGRLLLGAEQAPRLAVSDHDETLEQRPEEQAA